MYIRYFLLTERASFTMLLKGCFIRSHDKTLRSIFFADFRGLMLIFAILHSCDSICHIESDILIRFFYRPVDGSIMETSDISLTYLKTLKEPKSAIILMGMQGNWRLRYGPDSTTFRQPIPRHGAI